VLKKKLARLILQLEKMESVLIAYSGGVDSSLLLRLAKRTLGNNVLAVTADSCVYPKHQLRFARKISAKWGIKHKIIKINKLNNKSFAKNPINRCYYCKKELFKRLWRIARQHKINFVLDGSNASDSQDFRPGNKAKREFNIRSPLEECGIDKQDIYRLSRIFNLPTRNIPSTVCLASRIPYGQPIILGDLKIIEKAEDYIRRLSFKQVRLRQYNLNNGLKLARIELEISDLARLFNASLCHKITSYLKRLGYDYITLDLEGYRSGSMNESIRLLSQRR